MVSCSCSLREHPLVEDISEMLRDDNTHSEIRTYLVNQGERTVAPYALSRHARQCLGLKARKGPKTKVTEGEAAPEIGKVRDLAISIVYRRMVEDPDSIGSRELITFVTQAMKAEEGKPEGAAEVDKILEQLGG